MPSWVTVMTPYSRLTSWTWTATPGCCSWWRTARPSRTSKYATVAGETWGNKPYKIDLMVFQAWWQRIHLLSWTSDEECSISMHNWQYNTIILQKSVENIILKLQNFSGSKLRVCVQYPPEDRQLQSSRGLQRSGGQTQTLSRGDILHMYLMIIILSLYLPPQYVCGGSYTQSPGQITSPFYPQSYVNSMACIYDIRCVSWEERRNVVTLFLILVSRAPKGSKISLNCDHFHLSTRGSDKTFLQVGWSSGKVPLELLDTFVKSILRFCTL